MAPVTQKDAAEEHNMGLAWIKDLACIFVLFAFVLIVDCAGGVPAEQLVACLSLFVWHMPI